MQILPGQRSDMLCLDVNDIFKVLQGTFDDQKRFRSDEQAMALAEEPGPPSPGARLEEAVARLGLDALDSSVLALCAAWLVGDA